MKANNKIWKINKRCWWEIAFLALCAIVSMGLIIMPVFAEEKCPHIDIINEQINNSSCTVNGTINERCGVCGEVLTVFKEEKLEHPLTEYELVKPAGPNFENGILEAKCTQCDFISHMDYICSHEGTYTEESAVADCENDGAIDTVCYECHTILEQEIIPAFGHDFGDWVTTQGATCQRKGLQEKTCSRCAKIESQELQIVGHSYGDWWISKSAAPGQNGTKQRDCIWCSKSETKSYEFTMGANAIYAPGTSLNHNFVVCEMTQANVDKYNIVYAHSFNGVGPFILGHNTGSMRYISQIKVGQMIYVSLGGNIQKYKVVVSEFGMQNDSWTDIIGQSTGTSIFDSFGVTTLRMYTCYGGTNGRWIVLATKC